MNNIISTQRALTDLDNSHLQLNRHVVFIYVVIVFYLLSKARVLAGTSVSAPLQSGWFDVCWISLLSPCLVGLRGVKKNKGKPSRGDFPGVCSSRKHASKSIQFDGTCVQSPSSLVGGGQPNGSLALFLQYIVMVLYPCRYMLGFQSSFVQRMSLGWIH